MPSSQGDDVPDLVELDLLGDLDARQHRRTETSGVDVETSGGVRSGRRRWPFVVAVVAAVLLLGGIVFAPATPPSSSPSSSS